MSSNYQNKYGQWSVVTGASEGIGRCIAIEQKKGLNVVIIARRKNLLSQLENEIKTFAKV
jgi:short-subunit dehydrogenase